MENVNLNEGNDGSGLRHILLRHFELNENKEGHIQIKDILSLHNARKITIRSRNIKSSKGK